MKKIKEKVCILAYADYAEQTLDVFKSLIEKAKKDIPIQYHDSIKIRFEKDKVYDGDVDFNIYLAYKRDETEAEIKNREHNEYVAKLKQEEREREQLMRLKEKYEKGEK